MLLVFMFSRFIGLPVLISFFSGSSSKLYSSFSISLSGTIYYELRVLLSLWSSSLISAF